MALLNFGLESTTVDTHAVAVYSLNMQYAGPEEGGRWCTLRELVAIATADNKAAATILAEELRAGRFKNTGRPLDSVNFGRSSKDKAYSLVVFAPGEEIPHEDNDSGHYE